MKYTILAVLVLAVLAGCTTVPTAVRDAAQVGGAVVYGGLGVGTSILEGSANVVVSVGRDVSNVVSGMTAAVVPTFYHFP